MRYSAVTASITSDVGKIFHPIFWTFAQALALFYSLIPNYIIAITLLTVLVMILTAPLTIKSTKSMVEMQRIQPEFRKLQQKYKGDREKLNEEVMKLYREHGVSPVGGCLPMLLQMPFFVCLYGVIKGLTNTVTIKGVKHPSPRYLSSSTHMYRDILAAGGKIKSFGIDLSQTPFAHHGSLGASIPYYILFFAAIGLQYLQMARLNKRNAANIQNNPQMQTMQTMQKVTPLIFGVIYIAFPIGVTVYFIVSSFCRIVIQEILFRTGVTAPKAPGEGGARDLPPRRRGIMDRLADAQATAQEQRRRQAEMNGTINASSRDVAGPDKQPQADAPKASGKHTRPPGPTKPAPLPPGSRSPSAKPGNPRPSAGNGTNGDSTSQGTGPPTKSNGKPTRASGTNGTGANGRTSAGRSTGANADDGETARAKQQPPRSKDKRPRKAR
jgi:YidC/Oxa1 family membrane protein insertase